MNNSEDVKAQTNVIVPVLDMAVLQDKANEFAMKGAIECIKDYYSGYNSPFRKKINEELEKQEISWALSLPDIIGVLNDALTKEIDIIANTAINHTFVPMLKNMLTRANPEVTFSQILKQFVECVEPEEYEDCEVSVRKDEKYGWLDIEISNSGQTYEMTFHEDHNNKESDRKKYMLLGLPRDSEAYKNKMTIHVEGASVDVPFSKGVLDDKFTSYLATLIIAKSKITMDTDSFDESMFPEKCHCH